MPLKFKPFANPAKVSIEKNVIHVPDDPIEAEQPNTHHLRRERSLDDETRDVQMKALKVEFVDIDAIQANPRNAKKHPLRQIDKLQQSYEEFGFIQPIAIDESYVIIAGHARFIAAKRSGFRDATRYQALTSIAGQKTGAGYRGQQAGGVGEWDLDILPEELSFLFDEAAVELDFDLRIIGFETVEVDRIVGENTHKEDRTDPGEMTSILPRPGTTAVTINWVTSGRVMSSGCCAPTRLSRGELCPIDGAQQGPDGIHGPTL